MTTQTTSEAGKRTTHPGKFVWFEHASRDVKKAEAFYGDVLGWKAQPWGDSNYDVILTGETMDTMIGGFARPTSEREQPHWISYVSVDDVDATAKAAIANGGKVIEAPHDLPGVGRCARIADPQGADLCVFKNAAGDPADSPASEPPPPRRFFWSELHTSDPDTALSFYEKVLGFMHQTVNVGPADSYYILARDGIGRGGVTGHRDGGAPHWLPYVAVDDPDATVARAKKLGAKILVEATDIPGIGRFGVMQDPTGAELAVMKAFPPNRGSA